MSGSTLRNRLFYSMCDQYRRSQKLEYTLEAPFQSKVQQLTYRCINLIFLVQKDLADKVNVQIREDRD